jgi:hypothetical protein
LSRQTHLIKSQMRINIFVAMYPELFNSL